MLKEPTVHLITLLGVLQVFAAPDSWLQRVMKSNTNRCIPNNSSRFFFVWQWPTVELAVLCITFSGKVIAMS